MAGRRQVGDMGISGLLRLLDSVTKKDVHVSKYAGATVVIDAFSWLHKGYLSHLSAINVFD